MAAVCGHADIMVLADPRNQANDDYFFASGTKNVIPIGCAAGLVTLDELEKDGVYEHF